jgi:hypothetical protein
MTRAWLPQDGDCGDVCERTAVRCLRLLVIKRYEIPMEGGLNLPVAELVKQL